MNRCKLLSEPIKKNSQETETEYKDKVYPVYQEIFYNSGITFKGKRVFPIKTPMHGKYEDSFYHMTTRKWERYSPYEHRELDYARTERLHWIKDVLDNYPCHENCCDGILVWKEGKRTHIFLQIESYLIVLSDRKNYYTIVTSYVVFSADEKRKLLKRYNSYK